MTTITGARIRRRNGNREPPVREPDRRYPALRCMV
jgi:hypothetical protein